jgi:uncharacterized protein (TIGR00730 family)
MINGKYRNRAWITGAVKEELDAGLQLLDKIDAPIVTFLGSARVRPGDKHYDVAAATAKLLGTRGYAIMSGGGPGIMEAANVSAKKVGTVSIGVQAGMIRQENTSPKNFTHRIACKFLFVRRFLLNIGSSAMLVFPGGFGTLNELFEYVVLMQTGMIDRIPIILVNRSYWKGMDKWIHDKLLKEGMIGKDDLKLLQYADTPEEILKIIEKKSK